MSKHTSFAETLTALRQSEPESLTFMRGIEKEGLRVTPEGVISQRPHPQSIGSALTHPSITTDYSEALLEFITPATDSAKSVMKNLEEVHRYTHQHLGDERIWPASMPNKIDDELDVPIAQYGHSNVGQLKHVYRRGLWHRYGRIMQCIAGMHYNFSIKDSLFEQLAAIEGVACDQAFKSNRYFGLIRNFRRNSWLLLYLFGASPAVDKSFVQGKDHPLETWDDETLYLPYATSLRMSGLGYQSHAQSNLFVCFNALSTYTNTLREALHHPIEEYQAVGVETDGVYNQLNTNLLQIENEYYADIRPKRTAKNGEKPLTALDQQGVEYIEVRCLDLNPYEPLGISLQQIDFMDLFLAFCMLNDSPKLSDEECREVDNNKRKVVTQGRHPEFKMHRKGEEISLKSWANELVEQMQPLAKLLDEKLETQSYSNALESMAVRIKQPSLTPSARILKDMANDKLSHSEFAYRQAQTLFSELSAPLSPDRLSQWNEMTAESLKKQKEIEASDECDFKTYLTNYLKAP